MQRYIFCCYLFLSINYIRNNLSTSNALPFIYNSVNLSENSKLIWLYSNNKIFSYLFLNCFDNIMCSYGFKIKISSRNWTILYQKFHDWMIVLYSLLVTSCIYVLFLSILVTEGKYLEQMLFVIVIISMSYCSNINFETN